jgi:gluconate 2-dehydrogenase gamma chain
MIHRRIFLKILGATTAALSGTRAEQTFAATAGPAAVDHIHMVPSAVATLGSVQKAYSFFTAPEIRFIEAAAALLIPADELGGGAREAEVPIFIDWQLAGSFGANAWTYRQGPWTSETGTQGYQLPLSYRDLYRVGIAATDQYCQKVITHPYRPDQAAVRSGTGAARASRMAASALRPARRPVATTEQRSA